MLTRPFVALLLSSLGGFSGFFLLLPVVPLYVVQGGAQASGAGFVTGALMLATVVVQLATPWVLARIGYRAALVSGFTLLGVPALVFVGTSDLPEVLGATMLRGVGFGLVTVIGATLVAELVPEGRRGAGVGLYGLAVGVPGILVLPLGVWLVEVVGYGPVFVAGASMTLLGIPAALFVRVPRPAPDGGSPGVLNVLLGGRLTRLFAIFFTATLASGVVVTFVPLAITAGSLASAALFSQSLSATAARWLAGILGDRFGPQRLLLPGVAAAVAGVLTPAWTQDPLLVVAGMALFGAGFGTLQNATLLLMFARVGRGGYGSASAVWNIAFDAGTGFGAAALGIVAQYFGYGATFAATALVVSATLILAPSAARKT